MKCSLNRVKRGEVMMLKKRGKEVPEKRGRGAKQAQVLMVFLLQGVPQHWTPENLAKSQALYKHELDT